MATFDIRALEIHSGYAWDPEKIQRALGFMKRHGLNALVLHRNDIVDNVVYPGLFFGSDRGLKNIHESYRQIFRKLYKHDPGRRSKPQNRRDYLRWVIGEAAKLDIAVYLENKELWFPDIIMELYPEIVKNGKLCVSHPFWWDFTKTKYSELMRDLPGLTGVITSPGTGESRLSISASSRCDCESCRGTSPVEWYHNLIMSIYQPVKESGKQLIIRDFVFDSSTHNTLADALERLPQDITISLKNTPHDYYPTFPHNPRIGKVGPHNQWIEFDTMGQYYGWGIGISTMLKDIKYRLEYGLQHGAKGVLIRTDWEGLDGHSCFDTPNVLNLYTCAFYGSNIRIGDRDIYHGWLTGENMIQPELSSRSRDICLEWVMSIFERTWPIVSKTLYTNGCVFSDSSTFPVSLEHALWLAEEKNSLKDWDPSKSNALSTDVENVRRIIREKEEAFAAVRTLAEMVGKGNDGLTSQAWEKLKQRFAFYEKYVKGFSLIGKACILTKYILDRNNADVDPELTSLLRTVLHDLEKYANELRNDQLQGDYPYPVNLLLNHERVETLHRDLTSRLDTVV